MFGRTLSSLGRLLAGYLSQPSRGYMPLTTNDPIRLALALRPADVLLVEGSTRFSTAIKYLTQSTWSHAALYVGPIPGLTVEDENDPPVLIEADVVHGVRAVPLSAYAAMHTRICRPVGLSDDDGQKVIAFAIGSIGNTYDLKNIVDLVRYLLPTPPVPTRWRRRMISLGSGEPTKAICSSLIAQAFQSVFYPILPQVTVRPAPTPDCNDCVEEHYRIRHHSLYAPRDFDISPYFRVVKPTLEGGFDYRALRWDAAESDTGQPTRRAVPTDRPAPTT
jgi:Permuted papain-like amidase enzyme, YaeF/YiiX, C92 family